MTKYATDKQTKYKTTGRVEGFPIHVKQFIENDLRGRIVTIHRMGTAPEKQ